MLREMKKITFDVEKWKPVKVENANCPVCKSLMVAMIAGSLPSYIIYAYCPKCKKYFQAEGLL